MKTQYSVGRTWQDGSDIEGCVSLFNESSDATFTYNHIDPDKRYWLETGLIYKRVYNGGRGHHYRRKKR